VLADAIDVFVKIVKELFPIPGKAHRTNEKKAYTIRELLDAYRCDDLARYRAASKFLGIDLEEDLMEKLQLRDGEDTHPFWKCTGLRAHTRTLMEIDLRRNYIHMLKPSWDMPASNVHNALIKKFFPVEEHKRLEDDEDFRRERLLDATEKLVRIFWKDEDFFEELVFSVRCNYVGKPASRIGFLYEMNIVSICIQEEREQKYYDDLVNGGKPTSDRSLLQITRFVAMAERVKNEDVIVVASYPKRNPKIGLLKKGEEIFREQRDGYCFYCLQMKSVCCNPYGGMNFNSIDLKVFPALKGVGSTYATIGVVKGKRHIVYAIYYGLKYPLCVSRMSNRGIHIMCSEWLRSRFADEEHRIVFQLNETWEYFHDVDISGVNERNEVVIAHVLNTTDREAVRGKIDEWNFATAYQKVLFSNVEQADIENARDCKCVLISDVLKDFLSDDFYKKALERLRLL
jgi:hypothetical protein